MQQESAKVYLFFPIRLYLGEFLFSSFFFSTPVASGRCQETVTSHGINSFSPDRLLEETRLLGCLRNRGTLSNALRSLSDDPPPRASIPLPPIFHKICIRGCAADSCFEFRYTSLTYARGILSLSWKTLERYWNLCLQIFLSYLSPFIEKRGMKLIYASNAVFAWICRNSFIVKDMEIIR